MRSEGRFWSESSRISTGKPVKRVSENQKRHFKSEVNMSFPAFCERWNLQEELLLCY